MTSSLTPQEEIQRLNNIISILLEQVASLKRENAMLQTGHDIEYKDYTSDKNMDGIKSTGDASTENINGIKYPIYQLPENIGDIKFSNPDHPKNMDSIKYPNHQSPENIGGIKSKNQDLASSEASVSAKDIASGPSHNAMNVENTALEKIAPVEIAVNMDSIKTLASHVRRNLHTRVPNHTCESVARELLFIHNNGTATGHELRKAAGLSKPGFAKHLPMIKRRGLIFKKGVKKYALTQSSIHLINKVFGTP